MIHGLCSYFLKYRVWNLAGVIGDNMCWYAHRRDYRAGQGPPRQGTRGRCGSRPGFNEAKEGETARVRV